MSDDFSLKTVDVNVFVEKFSDYSTGDSLEEKDYSALAVYVINVHIYFGLK